MRRLLLLCLLLLLPLQGAWGAVAAIAALDTPCAMSPPAALHGAHGADASAAMPDAMTDCDGALAVDHCCDSGCGACHGHMLVALVGVPVVLGSACSGDGVLARGSQGAPDHVPELLLRPPLPRRV